MSILNERYEFGELPSQMSFFVRYPCLSPSSIYKFLEVWLSCASLVSSQLGHGFCALPAARISDMYIG